MDTASAEQLAKLNEHFTNVDESAIVVLKGHLILEEALSEVLETFVHHGEYLEAARLRFAQKVEIAKSMSLDEHSNSMWLLIGAINSLRNTLAHSLKSEKRVKKTQELLELYYKEGGITPQLDGKDAPEAAVLSFAIGMCLGFLATFIDEVRRFRSTLDSMDKVFNPHRHQ